MKKLLSIMVLSLLLSGNAYAKDYSMLGGDYSWGLTDSTGIEIDIKTENVSSTTEQIYTRILIYENCSINKTLIDTINIEDQIGKQLAKPFEIIKFKIKPTIPLGDKKNLCAGLKYKSGTTFFEKGDICINEKKKGFFKYNLCKIKNVDWYEEEEKLSRGEAADECSRKSKSKASEIRSQFYKDCMQDLGY